jgi:hypothetical protein
MFVEKSTLDKGFANYKRELFRRNNCQSASSLHDSEFVQNHNMRKFQADLELATAHTAMHKLDFRL